MPEWLLTLGKIAFWSIFGIGCWTFLTSAWLYFRDRSGNSGRENHWAENPRIKGARAERVESMMDVVEPSHGHTLAELAADKRRERIQAISKLGTAMHHNTLAALSDEDHAAYGAMVHAMKSRDDRRDENGL